MKLSDSVKIVAVVTFHRVARLTLTLACRQERTLEREKEREREERRCNYITERCTVALHQPTRRTEGDDSHAQYRRDIFRAERERGRKEGRPRKRP